VIVLLCCELSRLCRNCGEHTLNTFKTNLIIYIKIYIYIYIDLDIDKHESLTISSSMSLGYGVFHFEYMNKVKL